MIKDTREEGTQTDYKFIGKLNKKQEKVKMNYYNMKQEYFVQ